MNEVQLCITDELWSTPVHASHSILLIVFSSNHCLLEIYVKLVQAKKSTAVVCLLFDESRQSRNLFLDFIAASSYNWMKKIT